VSFLEIQIHTGWGWVLQSLVDWCQPQADWITLDVGCGPGLLPALLSQRGRLAFGVDLDEHMFSPSGLQSQVAVADAIHLPFPDHIFHLITASNLLFLLADSSLALREIVRLVRPEGLVVMLNPSEHMSAAAATTLADQRGLQGLDRDSLLNWAATAEANRRWGESELQELFTETGLRMVDTSLKVGPGLARFAKGVRTRISTQDDED
jgi:SAM-dependent methyltransferase